jgi:hypothetical protein
MLLLDDSTQETTQDEYPWAKVSAYDNADDVLTAARAGLPSAFTIQAPSIDGSYTVLTLFCPCQRPARRSCSPLNSIENETTALNYRQSLAVCFPTASHPPEIRSPGRKRSMVGRDKHMSAGLVMKRHVARTANSCVRRQVAMDRVVHLQDRISRHFSGAEALTSQRWFDGALQHAFVYAAAATNPPIVTLLSVAQKPSPNPDYNPESVLGSIEMPWTTTEGSAAQSFNT